MAVTRAASENIPRYHLYGEDLPDRPFDFVHIEPLRVRSELHDWTIEVHTHVGLAQLVVLLDGGMNLHVDDRTEPVSAPAVITIPAGSAHGLDVQPGSTGYVVMLADDRLDNARLGGWLRSVLLDRTALQPLDDDGRAEAAWLCRRLLDELQVPDRVGEAMIHWLTLVLLSTLARRAESASQSENSRIDRFREFRGLVEDHFTEHRRVSWYADRLHVSESSLNRLCDRAAGRTAFEVLQDRLELEARRRLRYTTVPVTLLARELGFVEQSYFSRFFRRRTGSSPTAFRRSNVG